MAKKPIYPLEAFGHKKQPKGERGRSFARPDTQRSHPPREPRKNRNPPID